MSLCVIARTVQVDLKIFLVWENAKTVKHSAGKGHEIGLSQTEGNISTYNMSSVGDQE